jgi:hypothetical protein
MKFIQYAVCIFSLLVCTSFATAQDKAAQDKKDSAQTQVRSGTTQDAVYRRPFITSFANTSVGGYAEANTNYFVQNGVTEGFSMEMRRFNLFIFSSISSRIKLLSEIEFERGVEEINLETALVDFEIDPALTLRGGIILAPVGSFNLRHDSPLYEIVERPLVATQIIPSTLSSVGFGVYGRYFFGDFIATYDAYIVNGLQDGIILNNNGRTLLQRGKTKEIFGESNNGVPAFTGKVALRKRGLGEIGASYYGGIYNRFRRDGITIDVQRSLHILALDANATLGNVLLQGEAAMNLIDVPETAGEFYGRRQWGAYLDAVVPVWTGAVLDYTAATVNATLRIEHVDYNVGQFAATGGNIGDEITAGAVGISFRPTPNTVFRLNYRQEFIRDLLGNLPVRRAGIQFGLATYF